VIGLAPGPVAAVVLPVDIVGDRLGLGGPAPGADIHRDGDTPVRLAIGRLLFDVGEDGIRPAPRLLGRTARRIADAPLVGPARGVVVRRRREGGAAPGGNGLFAVPAAVAGKDQVGVVELLTADHD